MGIYGNEVWNNLRHRTQQKWISQIHHSLTLHTVRRLIKRSVAAKFQKELGSGWQSGKKVVKAYQERRQDCTEQKTSRDLLWHYPDLRSTRLPSQNRSSRVIEMPCIIQENGSSVLKKCPRLLRLRLILNGKMTKTIGLVCTRQQNALWWGGQDTKISGCGTLKSLGTEMCVPSSTS